MPSPPPFSPVEAEEVRKPPGAGVDVDGPGQDGGVFPEDRLRAVAVMGVDVEEGDGPPSTSRIRAAAAAELLR